MNNLTLRSYFTDWIAGNGLFELAPFISLSWVSGKQRQLNHLYFGGNSGLKLASPYVEAQSVNGEINYDRKVAIATDLVAMFGVQWTKLYEATVQVYDPLDTMAWSEERTLEKGGGIKTVIAMSENNTGTDTTQQNISSTEEGENSHGVFGFNTVLNVPYPADKDSDTTTNTATSTSTRTPNLTRDWGGTNDWKTDETETETRQRSGRDTGAPQELLLKEFEVRKMNFYKQVFADIDSILALTIYDICKI